LIHGDVLGDRPDTHYAKTTWIESVTQLQEATFAAVPEADALISAAAISDYTVEAASEKIRSGEEELSLTLTPTPKLVDAVREQYPELTLVGFKAETGGDDAALVERARSLRERIDAGLVAANDASVMGADRTRALLVDAGSYDSYEGEKPGLGLAVADRVASALAD
jgi:phosphopantothenoylcysteine decarboxylase/phosphopantothenate--cysteine ligase